MGYENDPYVDEDGEPLMDFDEDVQSDTEPQGDDRNLVDDEEEDDWRRRERSPTPIYNDSDAKSKPRKRLIKKNTTAEESTPDFGIGEEDDGKELGDFMRGESDYDDFGDGKRKKFEKDGIDGSRKRDRH